MYPPCLATTIMIKVQTGSYKWMVFSMIFPTILGFIVASGIFTGGRLLGLSGIQMMGVFYGLTALLTVFTGLFKPVGKTIDADYQAVGCVRTI